MVKQAGVVASNLSDGTNKTVRYRAIAIQPIKNCELALRDRRIGHPDIDINQFVDRLDELDTSWSNQIGISTLNREAGCTIQQSSRRFVQDVVNRIKDAEIAGEVRQLRQLTYLENAEILIGRERHLLSSNNGRVSPFSNDGGRTVHDAVLQTVDRRQPARLT